MLHGEIDVGKNVKPGFVFPRFTIRVGHLSFLSKSPSSPVHVADADAPYHVLEVPYLSSAIHRVGLCAGGTC